MRHDRFAATLAAEPERIADFVARPETWQTPEQQQAGWRTADEQMAQPPPKLYQPAHNRFYLVAANLVCRQRGLPDRATDVAQGERTSFVIRRLYAKPGLTLDPIEPATYDEYGWIGDRQRGVWFKMAQPEQDAPEGEERLPLFPTVFEQDGRKRRVLAGLIPAASREVYEAGERESGLAPESPPAVGPTPEAHYVIRCVYDRPRCAISPPSVGRASIPFHLASYFDPDAPVRPLRVRMPLDVTAEGLAKFPKGVQFLISDQLRRQMARAEGLGMAGLLAGDDSDASLDLGTICSFSIPIITICALILLTIVVQLLNIVFQWLPLFRVCLPLPLKAK